MFRMRMRMEVLRELLEAVSTLVTEARVVVSPEGLQVKVVDPSHVAMLVVNLGPKAFEEFTGDRTEIGVDVDRLKEVVRLAKPGEAIAFEYDGERSPLIARVGRLTRRMKPLDLATLQDPKVPPVAPPAKAVVSLEPLRQVIRGSESFSDTIVLEVDSDRLLLHSESDADRLDLELRANGGNDLEKLEAKEKVRSMYPLDFFSAMMKAIASAERVSLYVGNEYPLKIEFDFAEQRGTGQFLLAPRVEED